MPALLGRRPARPVLGRLRPPLGLVAPPGLPIPGGSRQVAAASSSAMAGRARADGRDRPDSHRFTVANDTPSWRASCSWLNPSRVRSSRSRATSGTASSGALFTQAAYGLHAVAQCRETTKIRSADCTRRRWSRCRPSSRSSPTAGKPASPPVRPLMRQEIEHIRRGHLHRVLPGHCEARPDRSSAGVAVNQNDRPRRSRPRCTTTARRCAGGPRPHQSVQAAVRQQDPAHPGGDHRGHRHRPGDTARPPRLAPGAPARVPVLPAGRKRRPSGALPPLPRHIERSGYIWPTVAVVAVGAAIAVFTGGLSRGRDGPAERDIRVQRQTPRPPVDGVTRRGRPSKGHALIAGPSHRAGSEVFSCKARQGLPRPAS